MNISVTACIDRPHALRGNASLDAPRHLAQGLRCLPKAGRRASRAAFPRRAWERATLAQ
ncbi:DUF1534 domain-containing protein [Pseudomonas sp. WS 5532]|nr:DUF1534 domain-containing protein [Pseudomonas sp. PA-6-3C]MCF5149972.1 DUF1534 domain-containing protein [Pseudomonas sp. PA-6-3F]MCF5160734.1 DUF1534 domain-containing protein [Pseudomonas sp. PA-6-2E]MCF5175677.1 DUF1534 domain-containing protein [Pseudomonas sp. PA-6-1D]MCF5193230.1 DUF1534 domain-containing protein [Pseudomonas sp. PA-6-1H]MCF8972933.1 DUF1534 domain-containing protein [Pseudomonas edaphica]NMX77159.1 DUF1534 domain-containing protein [Pseudomonas sp. WS 5532]